MKLFDVHCHLDDAAFDNDLPAVIQRAEQAGLQAIISNGTNPESNRKTLAIAEQYPIVQPALGLYPIDALACDAEAELNFIKKNKHHIAAIGEIGMDFKHSDEKKRQQDIFLSLIELAKKINRPVIVHSRKAEAAVIDCLISSGIEPAILHCFSGNMKLAKKALESNFYFSIPANLERSTHFQKLVELAPLSHLLTETDAPLMHPDREQRNEPSNVERTISALSKIKSQAPEDIAEAFYTNFIYLFNRNI